MAPGPFLILHGYLGSGPGHWQDWLAMGFVMVAIASVLLPAGALRRRSVAAQSPDA